MDRCLQHFDNHQLFVQAVETGRYFFFTDDVITPDFAGTYDAVMAHPAQDQPAPAAGAPQPLLDAPQPIQQDDAIYLPERDDVSHPAGLDLNPAHRLRGKTSPAMLNRFPGANRGEKPPQSSCWLPDVFENLGRVTTPSWDSADRESDETDWKPDLHQHLHRDP